MRNLHKCLLAFMFSCLTGFLTECYSHDIPRQRVDRTIQMIFGPGKIRVEYSLELDDSTIAADLKRLRPGPLPADPDEWLTAYGELIAPRLAEAIVLEKRESSGVKTVVWQVGEVSRTREIHTIYRFQFEKELESSGEYRLRDGNFQSSEGLSRLGVRSEGEVRVTSLGNYPKDAEAKPYVPLWMLDGEELRRTREWAGQVEWTGGVGSEVTQKQLVTDKKVAGEKSGEGWRLGLISAFLLGAWHTLQPGHGKMWLTAAGMRQGGKIFERMKLVLGWVISHFAVIIGLACCSFLFRQSDLMDISVGLKQLGGMLIAVPAAYRLGDYFRKKQERRPSVGEEGVDGEQSALDSAFGTGLTAGIIPCWEAIGLLMLGLSAGHPLQGLVLVSGFVAGGVTVLIVLISAARILRQMFSRSGFVGYALLIVLDLLVLGTGLNLILTASIAKP